MKNFIFIGLLVLGGFMFASGEEPIVIGKLGEEGELIYTTQVEEGLTEIFMYMTGWMLL